MKSINDLIRDDEGSAFAWIVSIVSLWGLGLLAAILYSPIKDIYDNFANIIPVNASPPLHPASDTTGAFLLMLWQSSFGIAVSISILIIYLWSNSMRREV